MILHVRESNATLRAQAESHEALAIRLLYDRIDPSEVQALKDDLEKLKIDKLLVEAQAAESETRAAPVSSFRDCGFLDRQH